jgi:flavin reductase ActVB
MGPLTNIPVDSATFREAMANFPSGVTVVTTRDKNNQPRGFTASSFCSVSLNPPLVLVCVANSANSYAVFAECRHFAISLLQPHHREIAQRFADKDVDKFADGGLILTQGELPAVDGALTVLDCVATDRRAAGDHLILIGQVEHAQVHEGEPMVYFSRGFRQISDGR